MGLINLINSACPKQRLFKSSENTQKVYNDFRNFGNALTKFVQLNGSAIGFVMLACFLARGNKKMVMMFLAITPNLYTDRVLGQHRASGLPARHSALTSSSNAGA